MQINSSQMKGHNDNGDVVNASSCERFLYKRFRRRVQVPVLFQLLSDKIHSVLWVHHVPQPIRCNDSELRLRGHDLHLDLRLSDHSPASSSSSAAVVVRLKLSVAE